MWADSTNGKGVIFNMVDEYGNQAVIGAYHGMKYSLKYSMSDWSVVYPHFISINEQDYVWKFTFDNNGNDYSLSGRVTNNIIDAFYDSVFNNLGFRLLYQATRDGFSNDKFHSKCDYKGPTVFIMVGENGRRFGGFTRISWNKENKDYQDDNSFLFSLDFRTKFGIKSKGSRAIYCQGGSSVLFGPDYQNGDDFIVKNNIAYCKDNGKFFSFSKDEIIGSNSICLHEFEVYAVDNYVP